MAIGTLGSANTVADTAIRPAAPPAAKGDVGSDAKKSADDSDAVKLSFNAARQQKTNDAPPQPPPPQPDRIKERRAENFKRIDTDGNGSLTEKELEAAQVKRQESGPKTPAIDKALKNYDSSSAASGQEGVAAQPLYPKEEIKQPPTVETSEKVTLDDPTSVTEVA